MNNFTQRIKTLSLALLCGASVINAQGVYQLPYSNFTEWEKGVNLDGTLGTVDEPKGWNSFSTGSGGVINMASNYPTHEVDPTTGRSYVSIKSKVVNIIITKIVANGTLSTGRINANSATAADASNNYNYTVTSNEEGADNFRQPFAGRPDSLVVFLQFIPQNQKAADVAQIAAWIHNNDTYQDPMPAARVGEIKSKVVGHALINPNATEARSDFKRFAVAFDYDSDKYQGGDPAYMLFTATTNKTPGGKGGVDELKLDSIQFVYLSTLADLKVDGVTIEGFKENVLSYTMDETVPELSAIEAVAKGAAATVDITTNKAARGFVTVSISVKGNDYEVSGNETVYSLTYKDVPTNIDEGQTGKVDILGGAGYISISNYQGVAEIYNLNGAKVKTVNVQNEKEITLTAGIYAVKTMGKAQTVIVK